MISFTVSPLEWRFPGGPGPGIFPAWHVAGTGLLCAMAAVERTHSLGNTVVNLVWALPLDSCVSPKMLCALGDIMCLSKATASPCVSGDHRCPAGHEPFLHGCVMSRPTFIPGELVEGRTDSKHPTYSSAPGCGKASNILPTVLHLAVARPHGSRLRPLAFCLRGSQS